MNIGRRIRELRERAGLTQEQLASRIHTTKQTIYKYEQGKITNIPSDKLEAIALVLGVSPTYLVGWEDDVPAQSEETYTEDEIELITLYRSLNDNGKAFVEHIKALLKSSPEYYLGADEDSGDKGEI